MWHRRRWRSPHSDPVWPAGRLLPLSSTTAALRGRAGRRALEALEAIEAGQGRGRMVAPDGTTVALAPCGDLISPPAASATFLHPQLPHEAGRAAVASGAGAIWDDSPLPQYKGVRFCDLADVPMLASAC